jgi:hypothetical protein
LHKKRSYPSAGEGAVSPQGGKDSEITVGEGGLAEGTGAKKKKKKKKGGGGADPAFLHPMTNPTGTGGGVVA